MSASLLLTGNFLTTTSAFAAKPSPPPPAGTIYYRVGTVLSAVKADGTGRVSDVLPNYVDMSWPVYGNANPANRRSGSNATHDRWWIYTGITGTYDEYVFANGRIAYDFPQYDLFAVRSNPKNRSQLVTVQLTDLYGVVNFEPASACWSNDSNVEETSFIGCWARDIRGAFFEDADGTTLYAALQTFCEVRLPLTVTEIHAGWLDDDFVPLSTSSVSEEELEEMLWPSMPTTRIDGQGTLSPNGLYYLRTTNYAPTTLMVMDAAEPPTLTDPAWTLWNGSSAAPSTQRGAQWSPDGLTIAMADDDGNIWTQPASGASAPTKVLARSAQGSTTLKHSGPIWSPDSKSLVVVKTQSNGSTVTGAWLTRLSLSDGKKSDIVTLGTTTPAATVRWVSDN